jgi:hypothetical protein
MTQHPSAESLSREEIAQLDHRALDKLFHENRNTFPAEQLAAYAGQMVAWWPDGSRVFDADASHRALYSRLNDAGYPISFFPLELMPLPGQPEIHPFTAMRMRFAENRDNFPADELAKYAGKLVAWWPDGSRIVDVDTVGDGHAFFKRLDDTGYEPWFFVYETIPIPGESFT